MTAIRTLVLQALSDPVQGGKAILALQPPVPVRWMLLAAAILVSVIGVYLVPAALGQAEDLPSPFVFTAAQVALNVVVVALITHVGRLFGGTGAFLDALWLVGWMQAITALLLVVQIVVLIALPLLNVPVFVASVAVSLWLLVGFICALHGFRSRIMVLTTGLMVFLMASYVLSLVLLALGYEPAGLSNV
ncbi:MAG: YIP1 family protein [Rhodobacter sp.]|uniref:YIP1 family protein n=1 Tax=Pararhodobacter sp. TaxID=2127056 RepID=UPI001E1758F8|nr:YIP1 family protein [Pararhodobacter sp.]MCB1346403.1 YIP1 family protein [Paracoccaceae bacterium]MCC0073771.1 YIP1 family protein [Rhodobacter sp.]HPD92156.1 hypothetical protein [Pararhodobacter sp.]